MLQGVRIDCSDGNWSCPLVMLLVDVLVKVSVVEESETITWGKQYLAIRVSSKNTKTCSSAYLQDSLFYSY